LQHAGETGEVGLEPILLGIALGGEPQIGDHRVDVVFEFGDFAAGINLDGTSEVALGDGSGDVGNCADLVGEVGGQQVDVVGEVLPSAGNAGYLGLAAKLAVGADFAGYASDFGGEGVELIHHRVDGVLEFEDFSADVDGDLAGKVAA